MNKFWIILFHTYISKLKTKSFIITTLITALLVIGLTNMTNIINYFNKGNETEKIAVIDETGELYSLLDAQLKTINDEILVEEFVGPSGEAEIEVENGDYVGLLLLAYDEDRLPSATYKSLSIADYEIPSDLQFTLQQIKTQLAASQLELTSEELGKLSEPVPFERIALKENAKTQEELSQARG